MINNMGSSSFVEGPTSTSTSTFTNTPTLQVLIAEDNPAQQRLAALLVNQLGHSTGLVKNGIEAVSAIEQEHYDVILMDCQMPIMDGLQATQSIRKMDIPTERQPTIIGISASAIADECFKAGMDEFLPKPLNKSILRAVLGHHARKRNQKSYVAK
jgi:CheY-like chemotaxis protein